MIKIDLDHNRNFKTLDDFSNAYYELVKGSIMARTKEFVLIYDSLFNNQPLDFSKIDGRRKNTIISLLSIKKIDFNKYDTDDKILKLLKKTIYFSIPAKGNANIVALFGDLLDLLSEKKNLKSISFKKLLIDKPDLIEDYSKKLNIYFSKLFKDKRFKNILYYLLDYSVIHDNRKIRNLFVENLNVKVCPYCNRNYVSFIEHNLSKVIGPTLDHFLSKVDHPILSASFYNLVPSCYVCNSNIKGKQETKNEYNLNPFINGFGDAAKFILIGPKKPYSTELKIDPRNPISEKILSSAPPVAGEKRKGNAALFKINEIYGVAHEDEINMLMDSCDTIDNLYLSSVSSVLKTHATIADFYRFHFQKYYDETNFNKIPLSKLTRDLIDERLPWLLI